MKRFILIAGKRNVGKDFVASCLSKKIVNSKVVHFADAVKYKYAEKVLKDSSLGQKLIDDRDFKELHRHGLIEFSQYQKKKYGDDYWVKKLVEYCNKDLVYIISDLRFKSELFADVFDTSIKIKIIASNEVRASRGWIYDMKVDDNISETDLDDVDQVAFDVILNNNGVVLESFVKLFKV